MRPNRILALFTAVAVAWTSLWPLVSSAHALAMAEEMPLCHQAGTQVAPGLAPLASPDAPAEPRQHCPLCIMAFLAAFAPLPSVADGPFTRLADDRPEALPAPAFDVSLQLPPSRAPPVLRS